MYATVNKCAQVIGVMMTSTKPGHYDVRTHV